MLQAVVLAAGYASRAETNKLALKVNDTSMLKRIVMTLQQICAEVIVVSGHFEEEVTSLLEGMENVRIVYNEGYDSGMFSSVLKGMSYIESDCMIIPGDYPSIQLSTLTQLVQSDGQIRVPVYHGRKGHPIYITKELVQPLLQHPVTSNLKVFRDLYEVTYVEVEDEGVVLDVDTIEDYQLLKSRMEGC